MKLFHFVWKTGLFYRPQFLDPSAVHKFWYGRPADWNRPIRMAYLSQPASLIGQLNQLIGRTKLLRTVAELKF
jgi:hypothetical protein